VSQSSVPMSGQSNSVTRECDCLAHRFGNAADSPMRERRYPTDMSDGEWAMVCPLLPVPGWLRGRGGQPEAYCHRAILDAIRYLVDNGQCRCLHPSTNGVTLLVILSGWCGEHGRARSVEASVPAGLPWGTVEPVGEAAEVAGHGGQDMLDMGAGESSVAGSAQAAGADVLREGGFDAGADRVPLLPFPGGLLKPVVRLDPVLGCASGSRAGAGAGVRVPVAGWQSGCTGRGPGRPGSPPWRT
jgi:hypothetical protein